jgi:hypothetical protein
MSPQSRLVAGIVLIIVPTVEIGGASIGAGIGTVSIGYRPHPGAP